MYIYCMNQTSSLWTCVWKYRLFRRGGTPIPAAGRPPAPGPPRRPTPEQPRRESMPCGGPKIFFYGRHTTVAVASARHSMTRAGIDISFVPAAVFVITRYKYQIPPTDVTLITTLKLYCVSKNKKHKHYRTRHHSSFHRPSAWIQLCCANERFFSFKANQSISSILP
jgi:hypothetical protein